jgi:hypothetical protein
VACAATPSREAGNSNHALGGRQNRTDSSETKGGDAPPPQCTRLSGALSARAHTHTHMTTRQLQRRQLHITSTASSSAGVPSWHAHTHGASAGPPHSSPSSSYSDGPCSAAVRRATPAAAALLLLRRVGSAAGAAALPQPAPRCSSNCVCREEHGCSACIREGERASEGVAEEGCAQLALPQHHCNTVTVEF